MAGFVKLHRSAFAHPLLQDGERFRAFFWLVSEACWKPTKFDRRGTTITLERGQICISIRELATAWKWSKSAVERFLTRLETETMIETTNGTVRGVITICNYDKYQAREDEAGTDDGTPTGTDVGQMWDTKEEGKEIKKDKKDNYRFSGRVIKLTAADFDKWQSSYSALDLGALLQSRDDWLAEEAPTDQQKKWFTSTSNWLSTKQQQAVAADRVVERSDGPSIC
jgi:hypothetical protein